MSGTVWGRRRSEDIYAFLRRMWHRFARGTIIANDGRELCLERFTLCECHRQRGGKCKVMAIIIILEAYLEAHLGGAFFRREQC